MSEQTFFDLLPSYDEASGSYSLPSDELITVSIDFEDLCWFAMGTYPQNHPRRGDTYTYRPITEIGWTTLDTYDFTKLQMPPEDRAVDIYIYIYIYTFSRPCRRPTISSMASVVNSAATANHGTRLSRTTSRTENRSTSRPRTLQEP